MNKCLILLETLLVFFFPSTGRLTSLGKQTLKIYCQELSAASNKGEGAIFLDYESKDSCATLYISFIQDSTSKKKSLDFKGIKVFVNGRSNLFFKNPFHRNKNSTNLSSESAFLSYKDDYEILTIPLFSNGKINQYLLSWNIPHKCVDGFIELFDKHNLLSNNTDWVDSHTFSVMEEVDTLPQFPDGIDGYRKIIHESFVANEEIHGDIISGRLAIIAILDVDKNGNASFKEISRSSGIKDLDKWAIDTCNLICMNKFSPAVHRGRKVRCEYPIYFFKKDLSRDSDLGK